MRILQLLTIVAVLGTSVPPGLAQDSSSFRMLYSFTGQPDGSNPQAGVVIGSGGALYGTTYSGGTSNNGTVFKLVPPASPGGAWTETVLHDFAGSDGANPQAGVVGSGGVLYGTTYNGGASGLGTVFELTPPASPGRVWTETVIHDFTGSGSDGANPYAGVVIGKGGVLYGTTSNGGTGSCNGGCGTVFSLTPPASPGGAWTETVLHNFTSGSDGANPYAGTVIGSGGVLYGTTYTGGTVACGINFGCGTVFASIPPASPGGVWTERVLHNFTGGRAGNSDGANPHAGVVIGSGGVLYGTTDQGGTGGCGGRALRITLALGTVPNEGGLNGCGTVFNLVPPAFPGGAWTEAVLYSFTGGNGGVHSPVAPLVIGSGGVLYGTTYYGLTSGDGTVFLLTPPASPGGAWTETVLHYFTGGPSEGLVIGKNGVLYGTTSGGGTSNAGTVFALKP